MRLPTVSVLIPCFNAERYVGAAIESVLAQTYPHVEVIAVNDGSTDRSGDVLAAFPRRGVKVIDQANAGQCAAANRAMSESSGDLIKFFDADDLLHPEMIERQVRSLAGQIDAIAMGEWARFTHDPAEARFHPLPMYRRANPVDWLCAEWAGGGPMMQCAIWLVPRAILQRTGGWDQRLSLLNDFEFFARVLLSARELVYTPGARLLYRSGIATSLSGHKSRRAAESAHLSLLLGTNYLMGAEQSQRTRRAAANMLRTFDHTFYPRYRDLRYSLESRIIELGGSDLLPVGPPGFHRLRRWVGWRTARRIQLFSERLRKKRRIMAFL